jgi:hypothetical protein
VVREIPFMNYIITGRASLKTVKSFGNSLVVEKQQMEKSHVQPDQGPVCLLTWQSDSCCSALSLDVLSLSYLIVGKCCSAHSALLNPVFSAEAPPKVASKADHQCAISFFCIHNNSNSESGEDCRSGLTLRNTELFTQVCLWAGLSR